MKRFAWWCLAGLVMQPALYAATLAWWGFEQVGPSVLDYSGNLHAGELVNIFPGLDSGQASGFSTDVAAQQIVVDGNTTVNTYSLHLNGTNSYVEITGTLGTLSLTSSPSAFTIEMLVKLESTNFPMRLLHMLNPTHPAPSTLISPHFSALGTTPLLAVSLHNDPPVTYTTLFQTDLNPSVFLVGRWHHVAFVKQATNLQFYVDYQLLSQRTSTNIGGRFTGFTQVRLGTIDPGNNPLHGWLDEVRISDQALAPTQFIQVAGGLAPTLTSVVAQPGGMELAFLSRSGFPYTVLSAATLLPQTSPTWRAMSGSVTGSAFFTHIQIPATNRWQFFHIRPE